MSGAAASPLDQPSQRSPLRGSGRTLHQVLAEGLDEQKPAVTFIGGDTYTSAGLSRAVRRRAEELRDAGVVAGDRLCFLLPNGGEFLVTMLAASAIGAVSVPFNTALRGKSLRATLKLMVPCRVVTTEEFAPELSSIQREGLDLVDVWFVGSAQWPYPASGTEPVLTANVEPWDPAMILLTSGTTGLSKGVVWSHEMALSFAEHTTWVMGYTEADTIYTCLPMFHINALFCAVVAGLQVGAHVVVAERFSATRFWGDIVDCGATKTNMMGAIPAVLWRKEPSLVERAHALELAMVLPLPADRPEFEARFQVATTETYGSTDTGLPLGIPFGHRRPGSCGLPTPGWEVMVVDEDDEQVPDGHPGELVTRPSRPFMGQSGYWRMPELTLESMRNQWFHTGDICVRDQEGWFTYLDRKKDMIRVSGENVAPVAVEQTLLTHPEVAEAAAFAVPAELGEDAVATIVVPRAESRIDPAAIRAHVIDDLPYFAVPRFIALRDHLLKTATQKVSRSALRESFSPEDFWDAGTAGRPRHDT